MNGRSARRKAADLVRMNSLPYKSPDMILVHGLGVATTFSGLREWYRGVPLAMYYHGGEVASVAEHDVTRVAEAFNSFDLVFTNTEYSRQQAIRRGCAAERLRVLPVGFDVSEYRVATPRRYRVDGKLRVMSLGRLSAEKGLEDAIKALKLVVDTGRTRIHLSLAGDGYLRPILERQVAALELRAHVTFLGALSSARAIDALAEADVLVLPSFAHGTWTETQACAVQEALLMKALVVTTRTGGVPESIPESMQRFSVPERDIEGLAQALATIYDSPSDEIASLGEDGRTFVVANYDIRQLNRRLLMELAAC
jgi:colanic acid/amylovoran biosynthesis glycosyltransferase